MPRKPCEHGKRKERCRECGGSSFCGHGKRKERCRECDGSEYCEHEILRFGCKLCSPTAYCDHERIKATCRDCLGAAICEHNRLKYSCKECDGSAFCKHDKRKQYCIECGGSAFCEHNKRKTHCKECGGSSLCKSNWCTTSAQKKQYEGYCAHCYVHLFPDELISHNYKTKEYAVAEYIKNMFPDQTWICDKRVVDGCSSRRPDILCDLGDKVIIIEINEHQHNRYDNMCENRRIMEISLDIGHRPLVNITFNPDAYDDQPSCWKIGTSGKCIIRDNIAWATRLKKLEDTVKYWLTNCTTKTIEHVPLYFSTYNKET